MSIEILFKWMHAVFYWETLWGMQVPVFTFSVHLHLSSLVSKLDFHNSIFHKRRTSEKYFPKVSTVYSLSCFCVGKSCISSACVVQSLSPVSCLCTSQTRPNILNSSACKGVRNKSVSHSLSCLKWFSMDAIWWSHSLRSSSPMGKSGLLSLPPPIRVFTSVDIAATAQTGSAH